MRNRSEMKEWKSQHSSFPFLHSLLEHPKSWWEVMLWCPTSPRRGWDSGCAGNAFLLAEWAELAVLPVRGLCCDGAFIWITGSGLPLAWLLGRTLVQILGCSLPLSGAGLECWRSWQLHGGAGTPTMVGTARQGSAGCWWKTECPCRVSGNTRTLRRSGEGTLFSHIFGNPILKQCGEQNSLRKHVFALLNRAHNHHSYLDGQRTLPRWNIISSASKYWPIFNTQCVRMCLLLQC